MTDHPIDPHWIPHSTKAKEAVAEIINRLQNYEGYYKLRKRARKAADQDHFERSITAIVCALIQCHLNNKDDWVMVSLSKSNLNKRSRYEPFSFGKTLPHNLQILTAPEMGFAEVKKGKRFLNINEDGELIWIAKRTTLRPGPLLLKWIEGKSWIQDREGRPFTRNNFRRVDDEEVIILKAEKEWHNDKGRWEEYPDNDETNQFRAEVRSINEWIEGADITCVGPQRVDTTKRRLKRYFSNGRFDHSGRLFDGFWIPLKGEYRRRHIRINGKQVSELDYGQSTLRILYGMAGVELEQEDLYSIRGYEGCREGIKLIINAALNSEKVQNRMPGGGRKLFGQGPRYDDVLDAVRQAHAPIAKHFFTGIGMNLMYRESEILIDVLLGAKKMGIVSLPIHDSVLVPQSRAEEVRELMLTVFKQHTGITGRVEREE